MFQTSMMRRIVTLSRKQQTRLLPQPLIRPGARRFVAGSASSSFPFYHSSTTTNGESPSRQTFRMGAGYTGNDQIDCRAISVVDRSKTNALGSRLMSTRPFSSASTTASSDDAESLLSSSSSSPKYSLQRRKGIRNVAVIAHVDHGKTTLVDQLLWAARTSRTMVAGAEGDHHADHDEPESSSTTTASSLNRLLDSSDLEKERGITITSKVTRLDYFDDNRQRLVINCVDTPGHADFSAEVDRILSMVDGVVLVCDAAEGPKSQTKYVLSRAISRNLQPLVVFNKCDRSDAIANIDSGVSEKKLLQLFEALGASDEQMNHKTLYASAREGWSTDDPLQALELAAEGYKGGSSRDKQYSMRVLLDTIMQEIPEPAVRSYRDIDSTGDETQSGETFDNDHFSLAAVTVGYDQYLGRTCTGRIFSGSLRVNDSIMILPRDSSTLDGSKADNNAAAGPTSTVTGIFVYEGISRTPLEDEAAYAGDIITVTGLPDSICVGDTITGSKNPVPEPIWTPPLAPPTLAMDFGANNGPLAGKEGTKIASSQIRDRLIAETDNNVTLKVQKSESDNEKTTVYARGELQLGILIETMRREGFEMVISPPRVLTKECPDTGKTLEPYEEVVIDVDQEYSSTVVSALTGDRKGVLIESEVSPDGKARLVFEIPSRGLLGFNGEIATATRGSAIVNHLYLEDREYAGSLGIGLEKGKLVSNDSGKATAYALNSLSARGVLFIEPGDVVYSGMIIGENAKPGDMEVNPIRAKEKTNIRTVSKDEKVYLPPPKRHSVEELIGYMASDEMIEVTPKSVRLRKELMDSGARERAARTKAKQLRATKEKK